MLRFRTSLVALAVLLGACAVLLHRATAATAAVTNDTYCALLANKNVNTGNFSSFWKNTNKMNPKPGIPVSVGGISDPKGTKELGWRSVSVNGQDVSVTLVWGSEPAHAAAALLSALLRHVRLYRDVLLTPTAHPHATAALAANVPYISSGRYTNLVIGVSTAWEPTSEARSWNAFKDSSPRLANPRLAEFGVSAVPARRRLHAWLSARAHSSCQQHVRWVFYGNLSALADCDFVSSANPQGNLSTVEVLGVGDCNTTLQRLQARATATKTPFNVRQVNRSEFMRTLHTANRSLLFLDYDMWQGAPGVRAVEPPPCISTDFDCKLELDSAIAMRVADVDILHEYAPLLFQFVYDFKPSPESLRLILEKQANGVDIEEAACEWAFQNKKYNVSKEDRSKYDLHKYIVLIYLCWGDPSNLQYEKLIVSLGILIYNQTSKIGCDIQIRRYFIDCFDNYDMSYKLNNFTKIRGFYQLVGVVSMTVDGAAAASAGAAALHLPLMLADVVPEDGTGARATWRVAGRPRHIARALWHFVNASGWTRVAVLSQPTKLAADYYAALKDKAGIIFRNFLITSNLSEQQAQDVLQDLQATNARIVFVNADTQTAHTILTAAVAAGMGYTNGFVWIVREWRQKNVTCGTEHFTVSFCPRRLDDIPPQNGWEDSQLHDKLGRLAHPWPPRAVSLANALLTLSFGFKAVFERFPNMRQDLHTDRIIRSLQESLIEMPVKGIGQRLRYKERSLEETFVFVDQWCGSEYKQRLATWRVNATSGVVRGKSQEYANYSRPTDLPYDGASGCTVRSGDEFNPTCHDAECACALLLLALAPGAVIFARRTLRRRFVRRQQKQLIQAIARRQHVATVLAAYLVERAALELHEELGAGRFGSVRLARLREPGRAPRYIAAKALRDNAAPAEESEFLREACTIASLDHAHIVRLVGVCIADGPPLVLMELAFFGDLLGYLRARRHLVDGLGSEAIPAESGEEEHVSAEALTRLARQAAEALQYLCVRGVVHRDVRAANCLVDVRRSLKLADFGMARDTVAGVDGAPEYSCRHRGLFPVLWMAPESLAHGVFSAASDVWALGVLVLELVTLGMRPYGTMSPLRVLEYVAAGGSPPLPLDASPQTRGLARLCWARAVERRPSAAEVAAYLAAWPLALHPALLSESDTLADADSGFGESPSTELLPPDSPLHSLDQFEDLAACPGSRRRALLDVP